MDGAGVSEGVNEPGSPSLEAANEAVNSCGDRAGVDEPGSPSLEAANEAVDSCGDPIEDVEREEEGMDDTPAAGKSDGRYAYVDRGFTSELYKLEICNLPKFIGFQVCVL